VEDVIRVKLKILESWPCQSLAWLPNHLSLQFVIVLSVLEFFADASAYDDTALLGVHSHVPLIEESMEITPHEETVRDLVSLSD